MRIWPGMLNDLSIEPGLIHLWCFITMYSISIFHTNLARGVLSRAFQSVPCFLSKFVFHALKKRRLKLVAAAVMKPNVMTLSKECFL